MASAHTGRSSPTRVPSSPAPAPAFGDAGQTESGIFVWQQRLVSQMDFIWQPKGINMCLDLEVPPDNGHIHYAGSGKRQDLGSGTTIALGGNKVTPEASGPSSERSLPPRRLGAGPAAQPGTGPALLFSCPPSWLFIGSSSAPADSRRKEEAPSGSFV